MFFLPFIPPISLFCRRPFIYHYWANWKSQGPQMRLRCFSEEIDLPSGVASRVLFPFSSKKTSTHTSGLFLFLLVTFIPPSLPWPPALSILRPGICVSVCLWDGGSRFLLSNNLSDSHLLSWLMFQLLSLFFLCLPGMVVLGLIPSTLFLSPHYFFW